MFNKKAKKIEELREALGKAIERENRYYDEAIKKKMRNEELVKDVKDLTTEFDILNEKYKALEKKYGFISQARDYWSKSFHEASDKVMELEEKLERSEKECEYLTGRLGEVVKDSNERDEKIEDLEEKIKALNKARDRDFAWGRNVKNLNTELLDKNGALEKKVEALEEELGRVGAEKECWYNQFELVSGKFQAYEAIANKFMYNINESRDVDDTCIIHNGKVYTIVGTKHIVDNLGDTLDIRAELIDPEKAEKRKIGFKPEEKEDK